MKSTMSMNKKTIFSFLGIFIMFGMGLGISIYSYDNLVNELRTTVQNDLELKDNLRKISGNMKEQISIEKEYIIDQSQDALKRFKEIEVENTELLDSAKNIKVDYLDEISWTEMYEAYSSYQSNFSETTGYIKAEGDSKNGLRGELRSFAHEIETKIKQYDLNPTFMVSLLMLRRHEKDFLLRRDQKYVKKAAVEASKIENELKVRNYKKYVADDLNKSVDNYINSFNKLWNNQVELNKNMADAYERSNKLISLITSTITIVESKINNNLSHIKDIENKVKLYIPILFAVIAVFALFFQQNFAKSVKVIVSLSEKLRESSQVTEKSSTNMSMASSKVSSSVTQQASAIQETVATLNEITAMVNKSVENAKISSEKAAESQRVALDGKHAVNDMVEAIGQISGNNDAIMKEMTRSNEEIVKIVDVINEISQKTNVINDIVFQTKLLSFNASVEAARAGEHGKGFAVVAEEVGNLAQMSGNAALEIESLLSDSIKKVQSIVDETQSSVSKLVTEAQGSIGRGVEVSESCGKILDSVVVNVESVSEMMTEISNASQEQAEGINNITDAMNELDDVTHTNSTIAQETSGFAQSLSEQTAILNSIVEELEAVVQGTTGSAVTVSKESLLDSIAGVEDDAPVYEEESFPVFETPKEITAVKEVEPVIEEVTFSEEPFEIVNDSPVMEVSSDEYPDENDTRFDKVV